MPALKLKDARLDDSRHTAPATLRHDARLWLRADRGGAIRHVLPAEAPDTGSDAAAPSAEMPDLLGPARMRLVRGALRCRQSAMKRGVDIAGSLVGLIILSPLFVMVALLIKLDSRGPVFYRQQRHGVDLRRFTMLKFRSMRTASDAQGFIQATRNDDRVTRVGRVLRAASIDELPQLINVLMGHMSLIGPRPHAIEMDLQYLRTVPNYVDRYAVKPGITGLAQISGLRGPTDTFEKINARVLRDRAYIAGWAFGNDVRILARTAWHFRGDNAF